MSAHASESYRRVQVTTAAKDELLMLLLDGGVRFTESALLEMEKGSGEDSSLRNDKLLRAQKIVLELMTSLSPAIGLDLYRSLEELYRFTFTRLFEGNARSDQAMVKEGLELYCRIRDMWREAVEKARSEKESRPKRPPGNSTFSLTG